LFVLLILAVYAVVPLTLVVVVHFPEDIRDMVLGPSSPSVALALWIASIAFICVVLFHLWATVYTLRHQRPFQITATSVIEPRIRALFGRVRSRQQYIK